MSEKAPLFQSHTRGTMRVAAEDAKKIPQVLAVYLTPWYNWKKQDFVCGACKFAVPAGDYGAKCAILNQNGSTISLTTGSCTQYCPGEPVQQPCNGGFDPNDVGYVEEGPYSCKRCKAFQGKGSCSAVQNTPHTIDPDGCCNGWEKKS